MDDIEYIRYLNPQGEIEQPLPQFASDTKLLLELYRMMVLTRTFDKKAIALQRTGKIGTYPSILGQEALSVGIGSAMQLSDIFCPYYRDQGALFWRGLRMEESLLYWGGDERGSCFQNNVQDFPACVPIATQNLHAVGAATAIKIKGEDKVVLTTVGDGGTSRGDFYEAMNVAGVWELPIVFVINNNQWAISVPRSQQTAAETLAQKGVAAGISCLQIDGNDVFAVKDTIEKAIQKARQQQKPTVIEAITYRMGDHTTADDASRYRPTDDIETYSKHDPLARFKKYILTKNIWSEDQDKQLELACTEEVNHAVEVFSAMPPQPIETIFDYVYATLPTLYLSQREEAMKGKVE